MDSEPQTVVWNDTIYKLLLRPDSQGKGPGLFESLDQPGYGPPRHIHHDADETFYVLSGSVDFELAGRLLKLGPGDAVCVPRGTEHSFCIRGTFPARMLTFMSPGGFEGFFVAMSQGQFRVPQDMPEIAKIAAGFHLAFTGPPLNSGPNNP